MLEFLGNFWLSDWIAVCAVIVAIVSLSVTWRSAAGQRRMQNDREVLNQLILSLERSYSALSTNETPRVKLSRDRLAWLTAARHLIAYKELKQRLKTKLYQALCDEHEEFWRHQFYVLLEGADSADFFKPVDLDEMNQENIDPTSAAVVYAFSKWPDGRVDPLDAVSFEKIVKENDLFSGPYRHFHHYVSSTFKDLYGRSRYDR